MRVTIKDENKVGVVSFYNSRIAVRRRDRYATLKLVRQNGSSGIVSCVVKTEMCLGDQESFGDNNQAAMEYSDFMPLSKRVYFNHLETEKLVQINLYPQMDEHGQRKLGIEQISVNMGLSKRQREQTSIFKVTLSSPSPHQLTIRKADTFVEIVPNISDLETADDKHKPPFLVIISPQQSRAASEKELSNSQHSLSQDSVNMHKVVT